jgi:hypothetical protein
MTEEHGTEPATTVAAPAPAPQQPQPQGPVAATRDVWRAIKDHKVFRWAAVYLGVALAIAQAQQIVGRVLFFAIALRHDDRQISAASATAPRAPPVPAIGTPAGVSGAAGRPFPSKIAVLPCDNQSPYPADAYFASGLHQDIIWMMALRANVTNDAVLRQSDFVDVLGRIKGE